MNPRTANTITSSLEEEFKIQVFGYYSLEDLERFYQDNNISRRRIVFDGKPLFISETLAKEIVPNDGSHILAKLQPPKQNPTYTVDTEDPKPQYKNFLTEEFTCNTAKESLETLLEAMNTPTFILVFLEQS